MINSRGPRTEPWGMPVLTVIVGGSDLEYNKRDMSGTN